MKQKKKIFIVLLCLLFLPFLVNAESCDSSNIKLESIELNTTSGNAEEVTEASVNDKKINLDLKLYDPGDSVEYNLIVKNTSNEDFYFNEESLKLSTDYLEYEFIYDDNSNIVEAGKEKAIKLKVEYKNKVPADALVNDSFKDTNTMTVNLSNKDNIKNPETGDMVIQYILIMLIASCILLIVLKSKKSIKYMVLFISLLVIIPYTVYALCKCDIEIETKIEIDEKKAYFLTGPEVNIKMKQLSNPEISDMTLTYLDTNITAIKYSETEPNDSNKEEKNIVSLADSPYPIYMWYENHIIYWWSNTKHPNLNAISQRMCQMLDNLVDISGLKYFNTSGVTDISVMFWNTSSLENIDPISNWDVSNVTDMSGMFWGPIAITSLKALKNWDTSNVDNMFATFIGTRSLTSLEGLENWNVSKVTEMSGMFLYCEKIENLDPLKSWDVSNVTSTDQMFGYNTLLKNIEGLKNWNTSKVENMHSMFRHDRSLTNLYGLEQWDVSNVTRFDSTFYGLSSLEDASSINDWNIQKSANFNQMFGNAPSHPDFTNVTGTWNTGGTFIPN